MLPVGFCNTWPLVMMLIHMLAGVSYATASISILESGAFLIPFQSAKKSSTTMKADVRRQRQKRAYSPMLLKGIRRLAPILTVLIIVIIWQGIYTAEVYPSFLIPSPASVLETFVESVQDGILLYHLSITLQETLIGLLIGVAIGSSLGYIIANVPILEDLLSPLIVAFQSTPTIAYAPLLILWFGNDIQSKIVIVVIIVFFPTMMNTIAGLRAVPEGLRDVFKVMKATRWQLFTKLELPAALAVLLVGLKTSATLAVIGAVVGEFVSVNEGLGSMVAIARNQYDTPLVFVGVISLSLLALSLYTLVSFLEYYLLRWRRFGRT
ncbi:MAG: ABC transporter permease [Anaerolineaceae bacterium]|nr:ABC transporter permease [Anaerolineaceae bacterium]